MNLVKQLKIISQPITCDKAIKLGVNINDLRHRGLAAVKVVKESNLNIPKGTPKYASKFKFLQKKYGIVKTVTEKKSVIITTKGLKMIKKSVTKPVEEDLKKPSPAIDPEVNDDLQDQ